MEARVAHVRLESVDIAYPKPGGNGTLLAVSGATLRVERGKFVTVLGPSGCGKSSLLLTIAGLMKPSRGRVLVNGQVVAGPGRDRAMVFQDFALMPWRTALENVRFGLELQHWTGEDLTERARRFIAQVGLTQFERYYPHQLSGGMRQRVGIARALAVDPEILLLDEPFGALDALTRERMGNDLLSIWEQDQKTVVFITHSIDEAIFLGDEVVVMAKNPGRIVEIIPVDLPRPRMPGLTDTPKYAGYRRHLRQLLIGDTL